MSKTLSILERRYSVDRGIPQDEWGVTTAKSGSPRSGKNSSGILDTIRWAQRRIGAQLHLLP